MPRIGRIRGSRSVVLCTLATASLVLAGVAAAGDAKIQLSAAGQAAARAAVIKRADLGTAGGWTGGMLKPNFSQALECPSYRPKQSDLTVIGAAESRWKNSALQVQSGAQVLKTAEMVQLDWQRSILHPKALPCLRSTLVREFGASAQLVSLRRIAFPQITSRSRAYRALADVKTSAGAVRVMYDIVLIATGRTEITMTAVAPATIADGIAGAEVRLARALVARAAAGRSTAKGMSAAAP